MLPYDDDIVNVVDDAFKNTYTIPKFYFERNYEQVRESLSEEEVFYNPPMYFVKPRGSIEFSYIVFWTGKKFLGGYVSLNNNYSGVQRGRMDRNGETIFAGHIKPIRTIFKRYLDDKPRWICEAFLLTEDNKILYWGKDSVEHYEEQIYKLTGYTPEELKEKFLSGEKTFKPKGFLASIMIYGLDFERQFIYSGDVKETLSQTWRQMYDDASTFAKDRQFTVGIDAYMRKAYSMILKILS